MAGNWEEILEKMKADFSKMDPNIVETNLALTRAALSSWKEWVEVVSHYTEQTATGMVEISRDPSRTAGIIGKLTDANREYMRRLIELPQSAVRRYQEELRKMEESRKPAREEAKQDKPKRRTKAKN